MIVIMNPWVLTELLSGHRHFHYLFPPRWYRESIHSLSMNYILSTYKLFLYFNAKRTCFQVSFIKTFDIFFLKIFKIISTFQFVIYKSLIIKIRNQLILKSIIKVTAEQARDYIQRMAMKIFPETTVLSFLLLTTNFLPLL